MESTSWNITDLVVLGLGAALVVFFAGATAAVAAGTTPPTALWAAGSAVSGALIGVLVPAPGVSKSHEATAKRAELNADAATKVATEHSAQAATTAGAESASHAATAAAANATAEQERSTADKHNLAAAATPETKLAAFLLTAVFVGTITLAVLLSGGTFAPPKELAKSFEGVITVVVAIASASGGALVGLVAPSSNKG